jgi:hypothetical protein
MATPSNNEIPPVAATPAVKEAEKKPYKRIIIWAIIALLLLLGLYFIFRMFLSPQPNIYGNAVNVNQTKNNFNVNQTTVMATSTAAAQKGQPIASSENFDAMQINLEGSGTNVFDFGETELLAISNVASELYSAKNGDKTEIRALISCQTNKRSYAEAEYFKSGDPAKKVYKDTYLGFDHIMVIPALDPDSVYKYSISVTDLNQTKVYSEQYVFYTGAGNISLVDVLGNAVQKVFGWAIGK